MRSFSSFPVITCVNHFVSCGASSKYKPQWYLQYPSPLIHDVGFVNNCFADPNGEKKRSPSKLKMLVFVSCNNTFCGFGVFFTLLRKLQPSHFKMKSCFRIQIGNTYAILKTLRFFLWESKFSFKFNCNWQFSAHSVFPWVANLLLQFNSAYSAMMHRSSSLYFHHELTKHIFTCLVGIDDLNVFLP